ncbi:hypothetical protein ACET3Z_026828 [Daucus carota]
MFTPPASSARKHHNNNSNSNSPPTLTPIFNSLLKTNWRKRCNTTRRTPYRFASNNATPLASAPPEQPHFVSTSKNVVLLDWWLTKLQIEGSTSPKAFKFGVGGKAFDGRESTHFFSGEIVKRQDEITLENVEGITIRLDSLLNRFRTLENGFPSQVCDHFFLGFPFDWEEFGAQYFGGQSIHGARSSKGTRTSPDDIDDRRCLLSSFDDIPVTRLFDHMMVTSGDYNECSLTRSIFDHILSEYGSSSAELKEEDTDRIPAEDFLVDETKTPLDVSGEINKPLVAGCSSLDKASRDELEHKNDNVILDDMSMGITNNLLTVHSQSKMDEDVRALSKFVPTRSKTRSETSTNQQQEGLPSNTTTNPDTTPRTSTRQYADTTVTHVASVSQSAIPNAANIKVDRVLDSSSSKTCTTCNHLGKNVSAKRGTTSEMLTNSQELNLSAATLDPGVTAPIPAPEMSRNRIKVPQVDMESRKLNKSGSKKLRNLNTGSGLLTRSQARCVLTRSRAKLKKLRTDSNIITAEPDVTAEEDAAHFAQTTKISDSCPISEAEKLEKDESRRHVPDKVLEVNNRHLDRPEVRRSGRRRNVVNYLER